jgi:hypothetical protein
MSEFKIRCAGCGAPPLMGEEGEVCHQCNRPLFAEAVPAQPAPVGFDIDRAKKQNPYNKIIRGVQIDVYDVCAAYHVTDYGVAHAIKKLLCLGKRSGGKGALQDLKEAHWTLSRVIEQLEEGLGKDMEEEKTA